ncbi:DUF2092 domain-containing protein [Bradyrhizobium sp. sGM-13]|uniref:DUF2092 domain-containing protein n=1 Tax=Bradyrhizobium sp. sGM-13 TaxID=2831781 RepID=UPI0020C13BBD|nr:DUF2092 domain-containing protein [Bradyrhizobium sp. sGM-13]
MMQDHGRNRSRSQIGRLCVAATVALTMTVPLAQNATAEPGDDAKQILHKMSDYVAGQKTISIKYDSDIEVITSELQKIQFTNSGQLQLSRPDKLRVTRIGGYADTELVFDGKILTAFTKDDNLFAQIEAGGSVDQLVERLRGEQGVVAPGADLLLSNVFDHLMADVIDARHIGRGVIDGVECEHLAFRNMDSDWQLWIGIEANPIPLKYVITSKAVAGAPQYTLRIKEWKTDAPGADAFAFTAPQGAKKVALEGLANFDEVPQGIVAGGKK